MCFGVGQQTLVVKLFCSFADDTFISIRQIYIMYHKDVVVVASLHDDCGVPPGMPETCVDIEFRPVPRTHEQARRVRSMELEIRLASAQGWSILRTPPKTCQSI